MIERVSGVLLHSDDARYLLDALDALLIGRTPTARLGVFIERLRRNAEKLAPTQENTSLNARNVDLQQNSGHIAQYDLVDSAEAARILGCTPANVRDLARRGAYRVIVPDAGGYIQRLPLSHSPRSGLPNGADNRAWSDLKSDNA